MSIYRPHFPGICLKGHLCYLTTQLYKDSDGKDRTEFKCKICNKKGKCEDGAYVCA